MSKLKLDYGNEPKFNLEERSVRVGPRHCCPHHCVCPDNPERQQVCDCSGKTIAEVEESLRKIWESK